MTAVAVECGVGCAEEANTAPSVADREHSPAVRSPG